MGKNEKNYKWIIGHQWLKHLKEQFSRDFSIFVLLCFVLFFIPRGQSYNEWVMGLGQKSHLVRHQVRMTLIMIIYKWVKIL